MHAAKLCAIAIGTFGRAELRHTSENHRSNDTAVTARSDFRGMINVPLMDGSVRAIDEINFGVWRAISTRNGQEALPDDFNK